ncbi:hypothetical protein SAMN05444392_102487 [Seinonella peptonophila]|uniref:Uncharacterized protein n=1 Tax=Seinonella peptonophila TaxID=112248 RepID=A0A1M4VQV3_9BACL|nr:hypothetical protein [Seinonella peptonophila]SHE71434.1 hypothetical protein SAMN05444392_102487 [Seinonella peptonophila]
MKNNRAFILGLIGGIFAIILSVISDIMPFNDDRSPGLMIFCGLLGVIGAILIDYFTNIGAILLIIGAVGGLFSDPVIYILSCVLMISSAVIGFIHRDDPRVDQQS